MVANKKPIFPSFEQTSAETSVHIWRNADSVPPVTLRNLQTALFFGTRAICSLPSGGGGGGAGEGVLPYKRLMGMSR